MKHYDWPGNVRELENAIERAVVIGKGRQIQLADLPFVLPVTGPVSAGLSLEEMERKHIARVLEAETGNISRTAQVLRINRTTLYHKLKKYGLRS
jgi:DNA-binding NtrC family response regulator